MNSGAARRRQPRAGAPSTNSAPNGAKPPKQNAAPSRASSTEQNKPKLEGVYLGSRFIHAVTGLVGSKMNITTVDGNKYEGLFLTVGPRFDICLEMVHRVDPKNPDVIDKKSLVDHMMFPARGIVHINCENVSMEYAPKGENTFATDAAISSRFNGDAAPKDLEPWEAPESSEVSLTLEDGANGWDPDEMFRKNARDFNVQSTYDEELSGYTVALNREDTDEFRRKEELAERIAAQIERSGSSKAMAEMENGDEEEMFAAVVRPERRSGSPFGGAPNRYVPPNRRAKGADNRNNGPGSLRSGSGARSSGPPRGPPLSERQQRSPSRASPGVQSPQPQQNSTQPKNAHTPVDSSAGPSQDPKKPVEAKPKANDAGPKGDALSPLPQREEASARRALLAQEKRNQENRKQDEITRSGGSSPALAQNSSGSGNLASPSSGPHGGSGQKSKKPGSSPGHHGHQQQGHQSGPGHHQRQPSAPSQQQQSVTQAASGGSAPKGRDDAAELKKFSKNFHLSDQNKQQEGPSATAVATNATAAAPPVATAPTGANSGASTPAPANRPAEPGNAEGETAAVESKDTASDAASNMADKVAHSTLNPNAKEFVFNPNAKVFTPRSPNTSTPPRVQTPQQQPQQMPITSLANLSLHPGAGNPGMAASLQGGVPPSMTPYYSFMPVIPMANPHYGGKPRFKGVGGGGGNGGPPGSGGRPDMPPQSAVTGQPILASSAGIPGIPQFLNYGPAHGGFPGYPQLYMMNPGAMPMMPAGLSFNFDGSASLGPGGGQHHGGPQSNQGGGAQSPQVSQGYAPGPNQGGNSGPSSTPRSTPGPGGSGPPPQSSAAQQLIYHTGINTNAGSGGVVTSGSGPTYQVFISHSAASYSAPPPAGSGHHPGGSNPATVPSPGNTPFMIPHSMPPAPQSQASIYSSVAPSVPFGPTLVPGEAYPNRQEQSFAVPLDHAASERLIWYEEMEKEQPNI